MNEKIGCLYYNDDEQQYSIVGPGTIVRCRAIGEQWQVEVSYGHNWEEVGVFNHITQALTRLVHRAWEISQ